MDCRGRALLYTAFHRLIMCPIMNVHYPMFQESIQVVNSCKGQYKIKGVSSR